VPENRLDEVKAAKRLAVALVGESRQGLRGHGARDRARCRRVDRTFAVRVSIVAPDADVRGA
jgi:hypothetical protein